MYSCCIEIITQTASFRNPEFQNFHKTLDLPPPTTIIGLAGAAMGLSPKMAQEFFNQTPFKAGIAGNFAGKATDTWKYNRRTRNMHLYDPLLDGSVIQREKLVHNHFFLVFSSETEEKLQKIILGFEYPIFALTMGDSDSLAKVKKITQNLDIVKQSVIRNCIVPGNIVGDVLRKAFEKLEFSIYQTSEPIAIDLPTRFDYESDYGKREISSTSTFSFVGQEMQLNFELEGIRYDNVFIPLFNL